MTQSQLYFILCRLMEAFREEQQYIRYHKLYKLAKDIEEILVPPFPK